MALCWTLDKLGPLGLTADDCGLVLEAIAGRDEMDPTSSHRPFRYHASPPSGKKFKLGFLKDVTEGVEDAVRTNFERALSTLDDVAMVEEVELPDLPYEAVTRTILGAGRDRCHDVRRGRPCRGHRGSRRYRQKLGRGALASRSVPKTSYQSNIYLRRELKPGKLSNLLSALVTRPFTSLSGRATRLPQACCVSDPGCFLNMPGFFNGQSARLVPNLQMTGAD